MQFIFYTKVVLYSMCFFIVVTLLKNIIILHKFKVNLATIKEYEGNYMPGNKYILIWTSPITVPFVYLGNGQSVFISKKCRHTNCVVTANRSFLGDYTLFDVIAFHGPELINMSTTDLPTSRSQHQKYVFASIESPENYPLCTTVLNDYFNWTWTYRLDSDVRWGYMIIKDSKNNIIGPNRNMHWIKWHDMREVSDNFKDKIKSKTKAVAWFVSNCNTESNRESYALSLQWKLRKYNLSIDIYGKCTDMKCSPDKQDKCNKMIEKDYYFYLSFENSFAEDYVTEKLLIPLKHNAIPIVYGGANYDRFLPNGSYLNARQLGVSKLASKINDLIKNPEEYASYFRWRNYYSYHSMSESPETDEYCKMCDILNDKEAMTRTSIYHYFHRWWDWDLCKVLPSRRKIHKH